MKTSSSCYAGGFVLAATLVVRVTCQQTQAAAASTDNVGVITSTPARSMRNLQEVPVVGVGFEDGDSSIVISGSGSSTTASTVAEELIEALEQDEQVTGEISTQKCFLHFFISLCLIEARNFQWKLEFLLQVMRPCAIFPPPSHLWIYEVHLTLDPVWFLVDPKHISTFCPGISCTNLCADVGSTALSTPTRHEVLEFDRTEVLLQPESKHAQPGNKRHQLGLSSTL